MPDTTAADYGGRIAELADQADKTERACGAIATQQEVDGRTIANHSLRISTLELDQQKYGFRLDKLEEKVEVCGTFKADTTKKMAGLQRLAACGACLAMLDLIINFLQIGGVV